MPVTRRSLLGGGLAVAAAASAAALLLAPRGIRGRLEPTTSPIADRLVVIGDSYSQTTSTRHAYAKWSRQLVDKGYAVELVDLARGGMTASDLGRPGVSDHSFRRAVGRLAAAGKPWGRRDVTAIYLGHLDILAYRTPEYATLERSKADYARQLDALIAMGANGDERRILLVKPHDRGWNRSDRAIVRSRTLDWNRWLDNLAAARPGVGTADVFGTVEELLAEPEAFGVEELRQADTERSATTALMFDGSHFGGRGQEVIATAILAALRGS